MRAQHFAAQYLQMPSPPGGSIIKTEWLLPFDLLNPPKFDYVVQSWDMAMLEAGRMFVPAAVPWRADFLHELMMFPKGKYDDQVDATSQLLGHVFTHTGEEAIFHHIYEWEAQEAEKHIPKIRVNHPDRGRQIYLISGHYAPRDADGVFYITEEDRPAFRHQDGFIYLDE